MTRILCEKHFENKIEKNPRIIVAGGSPRNFLFEGDKWIEGGTLRCEECNAKETKKEFIMFKILNEHKVETIRYNEYESKTKCSCGKEYGWEGSANHHIHQYEEYEKEFNEKNS